MSKFISASELKLGDRISYGNSSATVESVALRGPNIHLTLQGVWTKKFPVWPAPRQVLRYSTWDEQHSEQQKRTWEYYTASLRYAAQAEAEAQAHTANAIGWASRGS